MSHVNGLTVIPNQCGGGTGIRGMRMRVRVKGVLESLAPSRQPMLNLSCLAEQLVSWQLCSYDYGEIIGMELSKSYLKQRRHS